MNLFVGTSGYSYKEWKGNFYPEDLPDKKMLSYYSGHFNTVEINNTFYRMPSKEVIESWSRQVPENFKFVIKAPKTITHIKKLEPDDSVKFFTSTISGLDARLGVVLFQMPPYFKKDIGRLRSFTSSLPAEIRGAFEFRNESWFDDEVFQCLNEKNHALCISDTDENPAEEIIYIADWIYFRFRRTNYDPKMMSSWGKKIFSKKLNDAYIFFKHEDEGKGPEFAKKFLEITGKLKTKPGD